VEFCAKSGAKLHERSKPTIVIRLRSKAIDRHIPNLLHGKGKMDFMRSKPTIFIRLRREFAMIIFQIRSSDIADN